MLYSFYQWASLVVSYSVVSVTEGELTHWITIYVHLFSLLWQFGCSNSNFFLSRDSLSMRIKLISQYLIIAKLALFKSQCILSIIWTVRAILRRYPMVMGSLSISSFFFYPQLFLLMSMFLYIFIYGVYFLFLFLFLWFHWNLFYFLLFGLLIGNGIFKLSKRIDNLPSLRSWSIMAMILNHLQIGI